ncbi:MAG TPA: hypothetical protein VFC31_10185 [Candidatus Limnocylindria bacterium]|nr:hypothetical protein [Candidatus Limnocylindria bacterium]
MRLAVAVAVSALAQLLLYLRLAGGGPILALVYIVLATLGAGWFAGSRAALAGALAVVVAAAVYATVTFLGPAGIGMAPLDAVGNVIAIVATFWPYIAIGAIAGALGGSLRHRVLGPAA